MSAVILKFTRPKPAPAAAVEGPRYYCLKCEADKFAIYESGIVHCCGCGARIRNLIVEQK